MGKEKSNKGDRTLDNSLEHLRVWYKEALQELSEARAGLIEAQRRASDAERRVKSIESLLVLENEPLLQYQEGIETTKKDLVDASVEILEEHGKPMRIGELRDKLLERGVPIPGRGNDANLIAKLQRSNGRVVRVSRGLYDVAPPAEKK